MTEPTKKKETMTDNNIEATSEAVADATELPIIDPFEGLDEEALKAKAARALLIAEGVDPDAATEEDIERIAEVTADRMLAVDSEELSDSQKEFKTEREHAAIVHLIAEGVRAQFLNEYALFEDNKGRETKYKAGFQDGVLAALNTIYTKLINMLPEGYLEEYQAFLKQQASDSETEPVLPNEENADANPTEGETNDGADTPAPVGEEG